MSSRRGADEDGLSFAVLQAILRVGKILDRRGQILCGPFVSAWLRIADGDKFDPRLLEGEDAGSKDSQATEAEERNLDTEVRHGSRSVVR